MPALGSVAALLARPTTSCFDELLRGGGQARLAQPAIVGRDGLVGKLCDEKGNMCVEATALYVIKTFTAAQLQSAGAAEPASI